MRRHRHNLKPGQYDNLNRYLKDHPDLKVIYDFKQDFVNLMLVKKQTVTESKDKKRITQKQLASLVDTKQPSISRFESGEITPSLEFLKKIAELMCIFFHNTPIHKKKLAQNAH